MTNAEQAEQKKIAIRRLDAFGGSILTDLFIANKKNGIREGFRRLALFCATIAFVYSFNQTIDIINSLKNMGSGSNIINDILSSGTVIAISLLWFLVVSVAVRALGWVIEGFVSSKK